MTVGDAAAVADLTTQLGYPTDEAAARERIADLDGRTDHAVLVAVDDADRAIGWIHVERARSLAEGGSVVIAGLVVDEVHRSEGIGADLLAAGEDWARRIAAEAMVVRTRTTRREAHRFYEREGYRLVKESRVYRKPLEPM
jgi:GNAT superfamily N-acetyltransferase